MYPGRVFVAEGGLISYPANEGESVRSLSSYVDQILHGTKVGDLSVEFPTRFDLVINQGGLRRTLFSEEFSDLEIFDTAVPDSTTESIG